MKNIAILYCLCLIAGKSFAQPVDEVEVHDTLHIAVFSPFYLDSAYNQENIYQFGQQFPKILNPGLEFWQGAQIAIDSLEKEGIPLEFHVYDTKIQSKKLVDILLDSSMNKIKLIFGQVNVNEAALLAQFARLKEIPFINVNLPNSVNQQGNRYYYILNATLPTHFKAIYRKLQSNYSIENIVLFRRKHAQDEMITNLILNEAQKTSGLKLKIRVVDLPDHFNLDDITPHLSEEKHNVALAASLDMEFARKITHGLADLQEEYSTTLFGMPTWDQINFSEPQFKGIEIYYTTPFNYDPSNETIAHLTDWYKSKYFARPSDMVFRGYEMVYKFSKLVSANRDLALHPDLNLQNIFTQYHILPVYSSNSSEIDYWENQKIYFVKLVNGEITEVR